MRGWVCADSDTHLNTWTPGLAALCKKSQINRIHDSVIDRQAERETLVVYIYSVTLSVMVVRRPRLALALLASVVGAGTGQTVTGKATHIVFPSRCGSADRALTQPPPYYSASRGFSCAVRCRSYKQCHIYRNTGWRNSRARTRR